MGHYCRICGRTRPNEKFSGKGHRTHICKDCARMPKETRDAVEQKQEINYLKQPHISAKNRPASSDWQHRVTRRLPRWPPSSSRSRRSNHTSDGGSRCSLGNEAICSMRFGVSPCSGLRNGTSQSPFRLPLGDRFTVPRFAPLRGHGFGTNAPAPRPLRRIMGWSAPLLQRALSGHHERCDRDIVKRGSGADQ
jgi:hypothetical protein